MSNKQKKKDLLTRREARSKTKAQISLQQGLQDGSVVRSNPEKISSRSVLPSVPEFYFDHEFACRNCGVVEVWTAKRQKQYYEEQQGEIEGRPIRCNTCRKIERERRDEVRRLQIEGMQKKTKEPS
ncbi:MAG: zinc-ribbon domain-containing protein [Akkermansiaceae bacterium]|nr:zinc-ribbon domain-containing protein [Akkermansiaceae bacterium]